MNQLSFSDTIGTINKPIVWVLLFFAHPFCLPAQGCAICRFNGIIGCVLDHQSEVFIMIKVIFKRITELPEFRLFVDYWYVWFFIVALLIGLDVILERKLK